MSSQEQISALKTTIAKLEARHTNNMNVILDLMSEHATLKSVFLNSENSRKSLQNQNEFLEEQLKEHSRNSHHMKYEDFCKKTNLELIKINFDLKNKVSELEKFKHSEYYNVSLSKKISDFIEQEKKVIPNDQLKFETARKAFISKIETDKLTIRKLSKQASDLQQVLLLERKSSETKSLEFSKQISDLEKLLKDERKVFETDKTNLIKKSAKSKNLETIFENERKAFEEKIGKLSNKLSVLETNLVNEQKMRSEYQTKYDGIMKEKDHLLCKIRELEGFSTDSSSINKMNLFSPINVCKNNSSSSVKSNSYSNKTYSSSTSRTHDSTLSHDDFVANSGNFKKFKMVWRKKSTTDDSVGNMSRTSPVVDTRSFVSKTELPYFVKSISHLISLSTSNLCCSFCGTNDFVNKRYGQKWYGTYSIPHSPFVVSKANLKGPNKAWVPKFVNPFWQG